MVILTTTILMTITSSSSDAPLARPAIEQHLSHALACLAGAFDRLPHFFRFCT